MVTPKPRKKTRKRPKKYVAMNDARRKRALELIESGEFIVDVAEITGVSRQTLYREKGKNEAFAKAWKEAEAIGHKIQADVTEQEMDFRGRIGWLEPKFFEGRICGFVKKYSDPLLIARMKALDPERYGDKTKVDATVKTEPNAEHLANLDQLSIEDQRAILEIIQRASHQQEADGDTP